MSGHTTAAMINTSYCSDTGSNGGNENVAATDRIMATTRKTRGSDNARIISADHIHPNTNTNINVNASNSSIDRGHHTHTSTSGHNDTSDTASDGWTTVASVKHKRRPAAVASIHTATSTNSNVVTNRASSSSSSRASVSSALVAKNATLSSASVGRHKSASTSSRSSSSGLSSVVTSAWAVPSSRVFPTSSLASTTDVSSSTAGNQSSPTPPPATAMSVSSKRGLPSVSWVSPRGNTASGVICRYFASGNCQSGKSCHYQHNGSQSLESLSVRHDKTTLNGVADNGAVVPTISLGSKLKVSASVPRIPSSTSSPLENVLPADDHFVVRVPSTLSSLSPKTTILSSSPMYGASFSPSFSSTMGPISILNDNMAALFPSSGGFPTAFSSPNRPNGGTNNTSLPSPLLLARSLSEALPHTDHGHAHNSNTIGNDLTVMSSIATSTSLSSLSSSMPSSSSLSIQQRSPVPIGVSVTPLSSSSSLSLSLAPSVDISTSALYYHTSPPLLPNLPSHTSVPSILSLSNPLTSASSNPSDNVTTRNGDVKQSVGSRPSKTNDGHNQGSFFSNEAYFYGPPGVIAPTEANPSTSILPSIASATHTATKGTPLVRKSSPSLISYAKILQPLSLPSTTKPTESDHRASSSGQYSSDNRGVCPFFVQDNCRYGVHCRLSHSVMASPITASVLSSSATWSSDYDSAGVIWPSDNKDGARCPNCNHKVGISTDERLKHLSECEQTLAMNKERHDSALLECAICMEPIIGSGRRFGLLSDCNHPFCLGCIRAWRGSGDQVRTMVRACPSCRVESHFVIPSDRMVVDVHRKECLIDQYKSRLGAIPCRHFNRGRGACPFGSSCFYAHVDEDGNEVNESVSLRHRSNADGEVEVMQGGVRLSEFFVKQQPRGR